MKRYCIFMTGCESWLKVAKSLYAKGIAEPVFWLGDMRHYNEASEYFGEEVIHSMDNLIHYPKNTNEIHYTSENLDFFFSENYYRIKDRCLKMMDRLDSFGTFNRLDREVFLQKNAIWALKKLSLAKPEIMIMSDSPHSHAQYLIYEIACYMGIPTFKFNTFMPLPLLFLEDTKSSKKINVTAAKQNYDCYDFPKKIDRYVMNIYESYENNHKYEHDFMKKQREGSKFFSRTISFFQLKFRPILSELKKDIFKIFFKEYDHINPYNLNFLTRRKIRILKKRNLKENCSKYANEYDLNKKFVYFALMHEPERTTNPDGGDFNEQFLAILKLRKFLPDDIEIFVKEHPTQFYLDERGAKGRSPMFYNLIENVKGLRFVGPFEDSNTLISHALFSASITGTVALESAIIGKVGLIFGKTWFQGSPNVFLFDDLTSYESLMEKQLYSHNRISEFLKKIYEQNCILGSQNMSAEKRFSEYIDDNYKLLEFEGIEHLMIECLKGLNDH